MHGSVEYQSQQSSSVVGSDLGKKRKENFTLCSDHNGSLLRRQPGASDLGSFLVDNCAMWLEFGHWVVGHNLLN